MGVVYFRQLFLVPIQGQKEAEKYSLLYLSQRLIAVSQTCEHKSGLELALKGIDMRQQQTKKEADIVDQRRDSRIRVRLFAVVRKILKSRRLSQPHLGITRDMSAEGMYFYTRMKIRKGDRLSLSVHVVSDDFSGDAPPKLEGIGQILRIDKIHKELPVTQLNGVAVQFSHKLAVTF